MGVRTKSTTPFFPTLNDDRCCQELFLTHLSLPFLRLTSTLSAFPKLDEHFYRIRYLKQLILLGAQLTSTAAFACCLRRPPPETLRMFTTSRSAPSALLSLGGASLEERSTAGKFTAPTKNSHACLDVFCPPAPSTAQSRCHRSNSG